MAKEEIDGEQLGIQRVLALQKLSAVYYRHVNALLMNRFNRSYRKMPTRLGRYRLLKLRTWSRKYKVELATILDILVPILANQNGGHGDMCPINRLTSAKSEIILQKQLIKRYPAGEYEEVYRARHRQLYLRGTSIVKRTKLNPVQYIREYRETVERRRKEMHVNMTETFKCRRYPENPWL